jgi:hypothetical protein
MGEQVYRLCYRDLVALMTDNHINAVPANDEDRQVLGVDTESGPLPATLTGTRAGRASDRRLHQGVRSSPVRRCAPATGTSGPVRLCRAGQR